jgi:hypothetical protein
MQPRGVRTDSCCGVPGTGSHPGRAQRPVRADGCCGGEADDTAFEQRADLGQHRRALVRRVALAGSSVLAVAALTLVLVGVTPVLADRLAWGSAIWAAGLVLGWMRTALTARRVDWRLVVALAAVAGGLVWQPLVAALVAVALLAERVVRLPRSGPAPGAGGAEKAGDRVRSAIAGRPG